MFNFEGSSIAENENILLFSEEKSLFKSGAVLEKNNAKPVKNDSVTDKGSITHINFSVVDDPIGNLYFNDLRTTKFMCREAVLENFKMKFLHL